ncbi:hypothetical protein [Sphingobacterium spiritivorum]|uniref:hypothetical protein n=1 Tax=Sphingobacterium spiritivorum TaxID=258 RepID=UPI003DA57FDB
MKRKLSNHRTKLSGIIIMCLLLAVMWACRKERSLEIEPDLSEEVTALSNWYKRQLIPTDNPESFAKMNQPLWSGTKMINKGDTLLFTTLLFSKEKITRELHVRYYDGVYNGVVRQYDFGFTDSLSAGTFTLNGRLIDMGYFDATNTYTLTVLAGNRNLVLMGTETINGGKLPEANVPAPPKNPSPPIWIPPTSPVGPPPGPSYPPPGWGSGGGGTPNIITKIVNNINNPCLKNMVDKIIKKNIEFTIEETLLSIFGESNDFNIFYSETTDLEDYNFGRATTSNLKINNQGQYVGMDINIKLNVKTLPSSSQEFITMVIVHESTHAYLNYKGFVYNTNQHDIMLSNYVTLMANYMINNFQISEKDAYALSFGGLHDAYKNSINNQSWQNIKDKLGSKLTTESERLNLLDQYQSGYKGQKCQ